MAAQLGPERWYHYNTAITTMKDVIVRTDPRNELIGLHSLCFYLKETFRAPLTCPQGPECTQPWTSQLVNECSLFFCQTTPTSGDTIEKQGKHVACCSLYFDFYINYLHYAQRETVICLDPIHSVSLMGFQTSSGLESDI